MSTESVALTWIVEVLTSRSIPFQAVGGLAARAYGSTRPLADLDFYVSMERFNEIEEEVAPYLTRPPSPYRDEIWDLTFAQLNYEDQKIELGDAAGARYFDRRAGQWVQQEIDFARSQWHMVDGVMLPVIPKSQLIAYKRGLNRKEDRQDIAEILFHDVLGAGATHQ